MPDRSGELAGPLAAWLSEAWRAPVAIRAMARLFGGAARETYAVEAEFEGAMRLRVLRRDPPASLVATSRAAEFHALARAHAAALPVPRLLLLDTAGTRLGAPALVMEAVACGRAAGLFEADP